MAQSWERPEERERRRRTKNVEIFIFLLKSLPKYPDYLYVLEPHLWNKEAQEQKKNLIGFQRTSGFTPDNINGKSWVLFKGISVNVMLRKIAVAAASKPAVEIKQEDETFYIKTSTTVRTTEINFKIGEEFDEQTVDGRQCKSLAKWESENKIVCEQKLLKGDGPKTSWTRELTNDGELILTMTADDVVCTRIYIRE
ncbi:unnamed protein product [Ranitomeya imitator]|uniref:Lipocalin/cytosolic fatty-acid binding domain-containing protein n=1 Tax=Ranitomeya imitator TaxID=111125 RepID=A0ABN9L1U3_9NEOB|nr:unnamed protein product [Ranitomeya imitator]